MSERGQKIRLGVFVLGSLLALAVLVILFGKQPGFLTTRDKYYVQFDNAPGIGSGTPVRRSGVRVGQVDRLELKPDGKVVVALLVDPIFQPKRNEVPMIAQSLLAGDSAIDFVPDPEVKDTSPVDPKDTESDPLKGRSPFDPRKAASGVETLIPSAHQSLDEIRKSFEGIRDLTPKFRDAAEQFADLSRSLKETMPELRRTNDSIRELSDTARNQIPDIRKTNDQLFIAAKNWGDAGERVNVLLQTNETKINKTMDQIVVIADNLNRTLTNMNQLLSDENQKKVNAILTNTAIASQRLDSLTANADQMMKDGSKAVKRVSESADKADEVIENLRKASKPLAERSDAITKNIEEGSAQLNRLMIEVRQLLQLFGRGEGTVHKLLNDPSLYNNVNDSAMMLARTIPRLDKILRDLENFADQIARHPEKLGISGAVRPSSGLKESPVTPYQPSVQPWK